MSSFLFNPPTCRRRSIHTTASRPAASTDSTGHGLWTLSPLTGVTRPVSTLSRYAGSADISSVKPVALASATPWSGPGRVAAPATAADGALGGDPSGLVPCPLLALLTHPATRSKGTRTRN